MNENKIKYRQLCVSEDTIPIFSRDWWLDATAGPENWDVCLVEKGGQIQAALPYVLHKKMWWLLLVQPQLTQTLGPWLRNSSGSYAKQLGREKDLLSDLIEKLPRHDHYQQNWHYTRTNWLPFYWKGFSQTARYTYRLPDLKSMESIWSNMQGNIRSDIRKAENRYNLKVRNDLDIDAFYALNQMVFERQSQQLPYSIDYVKKIDLACAQHQARQIFIAEDKEGRRHAGIYLIWDAQSAYYLMGGGDPELRNSGATSLCMWEAIRFAATVSKSFDFEGSMLEPVERFFRGFGAVQTPYFRVSKTKSRSLSVAKAMSGFLDCFRHKT